MNLNASDFVRQFFFEGGDAPAADAIRVDVLDSWTNGGLAAVRPTTISWSDLPKGDGR